MDASSIPSVTSLLHSVDASNTVYVQFQNGTQRFVDVIWIDYIGQWIRYETLSPGDSYDVYTYVTHPWVFLDGDTGIRLQAVGRGKVFFPLMSDCRHELDSDGSLHLAPVLIIVSVPVFTLKQRCLEIICLLAKDRDSFYQLNLPREIVIDLQTTYDSPGHYQVLDSAQLESEEEQQEADDEGFNETAEDIESAELAIAQDSDTFEASTLQSNETEMFSETMVSEAVANVMERLQMSFSTLIRDTAAALTSANTGFTSGGSSGGSTGSTIGSLVSTSVGSSQTGPPRPLPRLKINIEQASTTDEDGIPADDEDDSNEESFQR